MLSGYEEECGEGSSKEAVELRSRSQRIGNGTRLSRSDEGKQNDKIIIEKKVKPGDSLNKIALQYSVPVSELKRTNNLVAEQDLFALPVVRIPISRLRKELNLEHERELLKNDSPIEDLDVDDTRDDRPLLDGETGIGRSVEELFEKADASLAQVREAIPTTSGVEGAFHFVDARSPDHSHKGLWLIIVAVIMMFLIIPLVLTFFEEKGELFDEYENVGHVPHRKTVIVS